MLNSVTHGNNIDNKKPSCLMQTAFTVDSFLPINHQWKEITGFKLLLCYAQGFCRDMSPRQSLLSICQPYLSPKNAVKHWFMFQKDFEENYGINIRKFYNSKIKFLKLRLLWSLCFCSDFGMIIKITSWVLSPALPMCMWLTCDI